MRDPAEGNGIPDCEKTSCESDSSGATASALRTDEAVSRAVPLVVACIGLLAGAVGLSVVSTNFSPSGGGHGPTLAFLACLALMNAAWLYAVSLARGGVRIPLWLVWALAVVLRLILLPSNPILEVDLYRYLWDEHASSVGVDPYRFSPSQVLEAERDLDEPMPPELRRLAASLEADPVARRILDEVHYPELPTVYPPVSQWVFRAAAAIAAGESLPVRILTLKAAFLLFELATLALVALMLVSLRNDQRLLLTAAWCPLALKEVANSAHLDVVASFFCTAAVAVAMGSREKPAGIARVVASASLLALGAGAKIFPVVLLPLLLAFHVRIMIGWKNRTRVAAACVVAFAAVSAAVWLPHRSPDSPNGPWTKGLQVFSRQWEMNDFLFLIVVENLRPADHDSPEPWFVVVPAATRSRLADLTGDYRLAARAVVGVVYILILRWLTGRVWRRDAVDELPRCCLLALAWMWLLCPAQNPWYLLWLLPFLPFARNRAWYWLPAAACCYYIRFWMQQRWHATGASAFDYGVVFVEFAPWMLFLLWEDRRRRVSARAP